MNDEVKTYDDLQKRIKELEYDLSIREQIDKTLLFLSQHGWENPRESFFHSLARFLAETLQMDYVCIDRLKGDLLEAETFAIYFDGKFEDNVSYTLKETPCGDVVGKTICCFSHGVRHLFKNDIVLQDMLAESYVGTTLFNSTNEPIGLIAIIGRKPLKNSYFAETILKLVAARASGELERLNSERALKESEIKYKELFDANLDSITIFRINPDGMPSNIHEMNDNASKLVGYTKEEMQNMTANDFEVNPTIEKIQKRIEEMQTNGFAHFETIIRHKDGHDINVEVKAVVFKYKNETALMNILRDITERKQTEIKISKQTNELQKLNADKDRFLSILAHDLRNPFNSLLGFSELLLRNLQKYDINKIEKQLKIIHQTTNQTYNLLEDLLLWSKAQSGKLTIEPQIIVFSEICAEIINNLKHLADTKEISINCFEPKRTILKTDLNMFKTILRNLISNAIKFTNKKGQINIYSEVNHKDVTIIVSDNGVGIGKDDLLKLWDFTKPISTTGTADEKGTGFGLLLCKEFVEKHDGKIWAESEIGKGSDFKFTMPLCND